MNNSFNEKKLKFIINFVYITIILFIIFVSLKYLFWLVFPFIISIAIGYIVEPTVYVLSKELKLKRSICSAVCIIVVILLIMSFLVLVTATLYTQIKDLFSSIPDISKNVLNYVDSLTNKPNANLIDKIILNIFDIFKSIDLASFNDNTILKNVFGYFTDFFKSLPNFFITIIIIMVFSIFVSSSFPQIKNFISKQLSNKNYEILKQIKYSSLNIIKNYIKSYTFLMLITFTELSIAFMIFNIKPAFALALIISLVDILPVFGVGTIMVPWGAVLMLFGNYIQGAIVLSIYAVITVIRQIIEPKVIGDGLGIPSIITLPAMFLGLKLFGIIGLFLSPMIVTLLFDLNKKGYIKIFK